MGGVTLCVWVCVNGDHSNWILGPPLHATLTWGSSLVESNWKFTTGYQGARVYHLHWLLVSGHEHILADDLSNKCTQQNYSFPACLAPRSQLQYPQHPWCLTQQRAKCSWSSASRRPMHILFPMPNGRWAKGLIFFSSSHRSGLNWLKSAKLSSLDPSTWVFNVKTVWKHMKHAAF